MMCCSVIWVISLHYLINFFKFQVDVMLEEENPGQVLIQEVSYTEMLFIYEFSP